MLLEQLHIAGVGPCRALEMACAPRLNVLTGDNGLGKSFLLDVVWWLFTNHWPNEPLLAKSAAAEIAYSITSATTRRRETASYVPREQRWDRKLAQETQAEHVELYARVDGSFLVADTTQLGYLPGVHDRRDWSTPPVALSQREVWDGLRRDGVSVCSGLIHDWTIWQAKRSDEFTRLQSALGALLPEGEPWELGESVPVRIDDDRDFPTLRSPYGEAVPIIHLSAGMRRILSLAYVLVWAWSRHKRAAELQGVKPATQIAFLLDEADAHLHPRWQRTLLPSLLRTIEELTGAKVQCFVVTHSPLILASLEPHFDEGRDKLWTFDLVRDGGEARVELSQVPWMRRGDANGWLTSEVFDLKQARSLEAERALEAARALLREHEPSEEALRAATGALAGALAAHDAFWIRWMTYLEDRGIKA